MRIYPNINTVFFIWVVALILIANFGLFSIPQSGKFSPDFISALTNWDGRHFISIAQFGYLEKFQYAFFPLYPILINYLNKIIDNYSATALFISISCSYLALHFLFKLISIDFSKQVAEKTILFTLFFPVSFFLFMAYSEGLFFLLAILTFYFLRQNRLLAATIAAVLIGATRITGLAVIFAFILEVILTQGINRRNWFILLSPLGFFIYCLYLFIQTSEPFYFITAETHWQRQLTIPGISLWDGINSLLRQPLTGQYMLILDLVAAIFGLGLILRSFRFLPVPYSIFGLLSILLPLFTSSLTSMPRFLLPIFPIFLTLALVKNKFIILGFEIISLMFLGLLTVLFVSGYWVS